MSFFTGIFARIRDFYAARHEPEKLRPLMVVYWRSLLIAAILGGAAIFGSAAWEFFTVLSRLGNTSSGVTAPPPALSRVQLDGMLDFFAERAESYDATKRSRPPVSDPSR